MGSSPEILQTPVDGSVSLSVGDKLLVSGPVFCGRDAVLPLVCEYIRDQRLAELGLDFSGAAIFHTAVSEAGIGPTSSNKLEIEESFGPLCEAGVRVFLGKGEISPATVSLLGHFGAVYAVVPPVTALLKGKTTSMRCVAFPSLGMEALYEVILHGCPAVVAAVGGAYLFGEDSYHG